MCREVPYVAVIPIEFDYLRHKVIVSQRIYVTRSGIREDER